MASNDMKERLLAAGLGLFLEQGYNSTGIQQIANRAGAPKGSFYNYFSSKEVFGTEIIDHYAENLKEYWEYTIKNAPAEPDLAIRYMFEQMISYHTRNTSCLGCLIGNFSAEVSLSSESCREHLTRAQDAWCERLAVLIDDAQQQGRARQDISARDLAFLVSSVWTGSLLRMKSEQSVKPLQDNIGVILDIIFTASAKPMTNNIQ
ncbi:MAG: TetR/AcrR family transcriptional regulator [Methyloligellaceae bacterium]